MKSLFFRLMVSFLAILLLSITLLLFILSTVPIVAFTAIREDRPQGMAESFAKIVVLSGRAAQSVYLTGGQASYEQHIHELEAVTGTNLQLYNRDNISLSGNKLPSNHELLVEKARKNKNRTIAYWKDNRINIARSINDQHGNEHILVGLHRMAVPPAITGAHDLPFAGRVLIFLRESNKSLKLVIAITVASVVCFVLAKTLTAPIIELRRKTQQFAAGDYATRITRELRGGGSEIADLGRDFNIMAEKTETVIRAQKRLLRDISHELRSPLARLNVALELARKQSNETLHAPLNQIGKESDRINELISQLLTLNQIESGNVYLDKEVFNLSELLIAIVEDARFEALQLGRNIKCDALSDIQLEGHAELLRRAVENVIRNGIHYTENGTTVVVTMAIHGDVIDIMVRDFGPGVPEESLHHLFEPFFRVQYARERRTGGTGIGLAIASQALRLHEGAIVAQNHGNGLDIIITLPYCKPKKNSKNT